jgi:uncharacterized protein YggU (UPF0235/DUF167 family)
MRQYVYLAAFIVLMTFPGCSRHFYAIEYPIDPSQLPEFVSQRPLSLINTQNSTNEVLLVKAGISSTYINLKQFTEIAIATIKTEFKKRNIGTVENSDKQLKVSVTKVHFDQGWNTLACEVSLKAETGNGYIKEYFGKDTHWTVFSPAVNGALNHAVVAMLNDGPILAYLKQ